MAEGPLAFATEELLGVLECPVCHEHYRDPRMLPCGHTLCFKPCLEQIVAGKQRFRCPECRTEHDVPSSGIGWIPKNLVVSRRLDVRPKVQPSQPKSLHCPSCDETDPFRECKHCERRHSPLNREQLKEKADDILQKADSVIHDLSEETELDTFTKRNVERVITKINKAEELAVTMIRNKAESVNKDIQSKYEHCLEEITTKKSKLYSSWTELAASSKEAQEDLCDEQKKLSQVRLRKIGERLSKGGIREHIDTKPEQFDFVADFEYLTEAVDKCFVIRSAGDTVKHTPTTHVHPLTEHTEVNILSKDISNAKLVFKPQPDLLQLSKPYAVAVDANTGDVVVADTVNNRILQFDSTGNLALCVGSLGSGDHQFNGPNDIVVNDRSQMIVCDTNNKRIKIHNRDGSLSYVLPGNGGGGKILSKPRDIALDSNGYIHVCDWEVDRVYVVTQVGVRVSSYGVPGSLTPWKICFSGDGTGCVLCSVIGQTYMVILNHQYKLVRQWKVPRGSSDLCVIGCHILVCYEYSNKIHVYDFRGHEVKVFEGTNVPECREPSGMATDRQGNIYVACKNAVLEF